MPVSQPGIRKCLWTGRLGAARFHGTGRSTRWIRARSAHLRSQTTLAHDRQLKDRFEIRTQELGGTSVMYVRMRE